LLKILLVQSDQFVSSKMTALLKNNNFECQSIPSVDKAISIIKDGSFFDLIIVDANLPSLPGTELIKFVKQKQKFQTIPIIVTSSSFKSNDIVKYIELGACEIISIPFDDKTLITKIDKALKSGRKTVLIVDDDKDILDILKFTLELEGYKVFTEETAESGMEIINENIIHAVVSDILLPGMTGIDFMTLIKKEYNRIPVILITGHGGKFTPEKAIACGADGYFQKPFKNMELLRNLKKVLIHYGHVVEKTPQAPS